VVTLEVTAKIAAPWHVYSMMPVAPPGPVETTLKVEAKPLTPLGKATESAARRKNDPNFGKVVGYHEGTATFTQRLRVPPAGVAPGRPVPVRLQVRYMACNENSCLPPRTVAVAVPDLAIEAGAPRPEYGTSGSSVAAGGGDAGTARTAAASAVSAPVAAPPAIESWTAAVAPADPRPGEVVTLEVTAKIAAPWHVYSMMPVAPPGPVETTLKVEAKPLTPLGKATEGRPKRKLDTNFDPDKPKEVGYHEGIAVFSSAFRCPRTSGRAPRCPSRPWSGTRPVPRRYACPRGTWN
jgi:hypothetical protein